MPHVSEDHALSDDEIFFGKMTLKEMKKHIFRSKENVSLDHHDKDCRTSLKLVTQSQPNLNFRDKNDTFGVSDLSSSAPVSPSPNKQTLEDSFIEMENMVLNVCLSTENLELNNTKEIVEYILNNAPNQKFDKADNTNHTNSKKSNLSNPSAIEELHGKSNSSIRDKENEYSIMHHTENNGQKKDNIETVTPSSSQHTELEVAINPHIKQSCATLKKIENGNNHYKHIKSPIAFLVKKCPYIPPFKDHRQTPLPRPSSIPKFVKKNMQYNIKNKENINLLSTGNKNTKITELNPQHNEEKKKHPTSK